MASLFIVQLPFGHNSYCPIYPYSIYRAATIKTWLFQATTIFTHPPSTCFSFYYPFIRLKTFTIFICSSFPGSKFVYSINANNFVSVCQVTTIVNNTHMYTFFPIKPLYLQSQKRYWQRQGVCLIFMVIYYTPISIHTKTPYVNFTLLHTKLFHKKFWMIVSFRRIQSLEAKTKNKELIWKLHQQ